MKRRRKRRKKRDKNPAGLDNMQKPGYNSKDEKGEIFKTLARHARGIAHAAEKLAALRESEHSGSEPKGSHPKDERAAESKTSDGESGNPKQ